MRFVRIISTAILGLLFFLFVAVDLVVFDVIALDSAVVALLPLLGLLLGGALGALAFNRAHARDPQPAMDAAAPANSPE